MSAFIVSKTTMDHVVGAIDQLRNQSCKAFTFGGLPVETSEDLNALGQALYRMNLDSVLQRYPSDTRESAPGPVDLSDIHENYRYRLSARFVSKAQRYKSVGCLLYQSCEGSVPEDNRLYKALNDLHNQMAHDIASNNQDYRQAVWDAA